MGFLHLHPSVVIKRLLVWREKMWVCMPFSLSYLAVELELELELELPGKFGYNAGNSYSCRRLS